MASTVVDLKSEVDHLRQQLHYADEVSYNGRFVWVINEVVERTTVIHQSDLTKGHTILCKQSALFYTSRFFFFLIIKKPRCFICYALYIQIRIQGGTEAKIDTHLDQFMVYF